MTNSSWPSHPNRFVLVPTIVAVTDRPFSGLLSYYALARLQRTDLLRNGHPVIQLPSHAAHPAVAVHARFA